MTAVARISIVESRLAAQPERLAALGPAKGLQNLLAELAESGLCPQRWTEQAVIETIVRSAASSMASVKSALRGWAGFADAALAAEGRHLPPSEQGLVAWSQHFRCAGTYVNYVGYLRLGCQVMGLDSRGVGGPIVDRAKRMLKRDGAEPRAKLALRADLLRRLMGTARAHGQEVMAMLYLASYLFMLRVPSEGLPMTVGSDTAAPLGGAHSCVAVVGRQLVLKLARRKNRPRGSTLKRGCSCPQSSWMCPVHVLGDWLAAQPCGTAPFAAISAARARALLREHLASMGIADAQAHSLHDFRRGHARDLAEAGASPDSIKALGEWVSPAFLKYLDVSTVEAQYVLQAHLDDSEDDDV